MNDIELEALDKSFNEYEKAHKRSINGWLLITVFGVVASTLCALSCYFNMQDKHYIIAGLMLLLFWFDIYTVIKCVARREIEIFHFKDMKRKHELFMEQMRSEKD